MAAQVHGTVADARFDKLVGLLAENTESGAEVGASLAVDVRGTTLVDVWAGHADGGRTRPWTQDTVVNLWSCTKVATNIAALILVDRGDIDVFAPVARYWPEFAANGKQDVQVRHLMAHTSGVSGWSAPWDHDDMYDWEKATSRLAEQPPWWEPGTAGGYHASNQGHLVGEVVRRVSGMPLKEFVRTQLAAPLGADIQIGARVEDVGRVADIIPPVGGVPIDWSALDADSPMVKTFATAAGFADKANTAEWRAADMGGVNGHGNARSLARLGSVISGNGEVDGVRLLGERTIDLVFQQQYEGIDLVLGVPLRWGIGLGLPHPESAPFIRQGRTCFWCGWGGSIVIMHPDTGLTIAYAMNAMGEGIIGNPRTVQYVEAVYEALA